MVENQTQSYVQGVLVQKLAPKIFAIIIAMLLISLDAGAGVVANVDRGDVELNESFTL